MQAISFSSAYLMSIVDVLAVLRKHCVPIGANLSIRVKFSDVAAPKLAFARVLAPLLVLAFQRGFVLLGFIFMSTEILVVSLICLFFFNLYLHDSNPHPPGVVSALPATKWQSQLSSNLSKFAAYEPPFWCLDQHWSTMLPLVLFKPRPVPLLRQTFLARDGSPISLDWHVPTAASSLRGVILAGAGMNGTSQAGYMVDLMKRVGDHGFAVAAITGRGMGGTPITSPEELYHLGRTSDLLDSLEAVEEILKEVSPEKKFPIYLMGFSAGGIRAMKFAAVYGESIKGRVAGIVSFGGTVKSEKTHDMRMSVLAYQPVIAHASRVRIRSQLSFGVSSREMESSLPLPPFRSFRDFDRKITTVIHNMSVEEYYNQSFAFSDDRWRDIAVPVLVVNSADDPVLHIEDAVVPEIACGNSNVTFLVTRKGGHIGWPTGLSTEDHGFKWMSDVLLCYIDSIPSY